MKKSVKNIAFIVLSALVGTANGFFGGGGGMLLVPLLEKVRGLPVQKAHATAIAVILPTSIAGAVTYIAGGCFEPWIFGCVSAGCAAGGALGALLLGKIPPLATALAFAAIMVGMGVKLTFF